MGDVRVVYRLLQYSFRYWQRFILLLFVALIGVVLEVAKPWPLKLIIDSVLSDHPIPSIIGGLNLGSGGVPAKELLLTWIIAAAIILAVGSAVVSFLVSGMTISIAQRLVYDFSLELFNKLQQLSLTYYGRNKVGDILQRVSADVYVVYFVVAQITLPLIISSVSLAAMFYIMAQLNPSLTLIAAAVVPLLVISIYAFSKPMDETTSRQYETQGDLMAFMQQSLLAVKVVQGFARESLMHSKLSERAMRFSKAYKTANQVSLGYGQSATLITAVAAVAMLGLGTRDVLRGNLSIGELFVFLGYLAALYALVNALTVAIGTAITIGARGRRVFEILDSDEVVAEKPGAVALNNVRGKVRFENVSFSYPAVNGEVRPVLDNINIQADPGQITAIVGATGAGKTTLVSLLSRFYEPGEGKITIDDLDIRDLTLASLRENISLVLQEPFLFPVSILENIAFGRPDASRQEIIGAARAAQADTFISRLPEGYDTVISEGGASLSGGEKQRISIARALLKDAPILILDEPTSSLDAHTEAQIFKALETLMKGRTTFIISHRLSTIKSADQIITLKDGHIVERGTHESLLSAGKVYADLYRHQHIAAM